METYPTLGSSENHRLKMPFLGGYVIVPWRVSFFQASGQIWYISPTWISLKWENFPHLTTIWGWKLVCSVAITWPKAYMICKCVTVFTSCQPLVNWLVVSTYLKKYARQLGSFAKKIGMKIKNIWNHHLVIWFNIYPIRLNSSNDHNLQVCLFPVGTPCLAIDLHWGTGCLRVSQKGVTVWFAPPATGSDWKYQKPNSTFLHFSSWWFFSNPFENYERQIGFIFPKVSGWKFQKIFKLPPASFEVPSSEQAKSWSSKPL